MIPGLVSFPARPPYARAVNFDGTNDYMLRGADPTGNADGKQGIVSFWTRIGGGDGANRTLWINNTAAHFRGRLITTDKFNILGQNAATTIILNMNSNTARPAGAAWLHFLIAWNLATAVGQLYVNDASDLAAGATLTNDTIDYTGTDFGIGATLTGGNKYNGDVAELYINVATTLDISVADNRRKFISPDLKPVYLGGNGQIPTGTAPIVYLQGPALEFPTNLGGGGNFTVTGALTDAATSPSA